jgi:hypothetical protein
MPTAGHRAGRVRAPARAPGRDPMAARRGPADRWPGGGRRPVPSHGAGAGDPAPGQRRRHGRGQSRRRSALPRRRAPGSTPRGPRHQRGPASPSAACRTPSRSSGTSRCTCPRARVVASQFGTVVGRRLSRGRPSRAAYPHDGRGRRVRRGVAARARVPARPPFNGSGSLAAGPAESDPLTAALVVARVHVRPRMSARSRWG